MKNPADAKLSRTRTNAIPIQILELQNLCDVAEPDQPSPYMFRGMHRQHQQQIFGRRSFHSASCNCDAHRALEESIHIEVNRVEARLQRPLQFEQVTPRRTVEGTFVSRSDVILLGVRWNRHTQ